MKRQVILGLVLMGGGFQASVGSAGALEPSANGPAPVSTVLSAERLAFAPEASPTVLAYRRTPPRTYPPPPSSRYVPPQEEWKAQGWLTLRGGGYDSKSVSENDWTVGFKAVGVVASSIRMGMTADLVRREGANRTFVTERVDQSGNVVRTELTTSESESNLVPVLAVAELVFPTPFFKPYAGVGGGWEFLNVKAVDYTSGLGYEANYNGPGWQLYGGVNLAFSERFQLNGELFHNEATVEREVFDPVLGAAYEERVDVGGTGLRGGLSFAF